MVKIFYPLLLAFMMLFIYSSSHAQKDTKTQVEKALRLWNNAAKQRDLKTIISYFDESANILLAGSDSAEIFKGKKQISTWLAALLEHHSFEWEMNRIDIDSYMDVAWVFVDGAMIVTNDNGKTNKTPYRFTGVLVKKNNQWKWRLFDGSIPKGE